MTAMLHLNNFLVLQVYQYPSSGKNIYRNHYRLIINKTIVFSCYQCSMCMIARAQAHTQVSLCVQFIAHEKSYFHFLLTAIWLAQNQLWTIIKEAASLTQC